MNADAETLGNLYANSCIFVSGQQDGVRNGAIAGQVDQIRDNQGVYTFLLTIGSDDTQAQLYVICISNISVFA